MERFLLGWLTMVLSIPMLFIAMFLNLGELGLVLIFLPFILGIILILSDIDYDGWGAYL